nr:hypothetical protein [Tanacetum cinerariifolium]
GPPHQALKNKGIVDSGCSRHMTRKKAYLVDRKAVVISKSSVRSDLLFNDEDGIACLTNAEIFKTLQ